MRILFQVLLHQNGTVNIGKYSLSHILLGYGCHHGVIWYIDYKNILRADYRHIFGTLFAGSLNGMLQLLHQPAVDIDSPFIQASSGVLGKVQSILCALISEQFLKGCFSAFASRKS